MVIAYDLEVERHSQEIKWTQLLDIVSLVAFTAAKIQPFL